MRMTVKALKRLINEASPYHDQRNFENGIPHYPGHGDDASPQWLVVLRAGKFLGTGVIFKNDIPWDKNDDPSSKDAETLTRNGYNEEGAERKAEEFLSAQGPGWAQWCDGATGEPVDEDDDELNEEFTSFDVLKVVNLAHNPNAPTDPQSWQRRGRF